VSNDYVAWKTDAFAAPLIGYWAPTIRPVADDVRSKTAQETAPVSHLDGTPPRRCCRNARPPDGCLFGDFVNIAHSQRLLAVPVGFRLQPLRG